MRERDEARFASHRFLDLLSCHRGREESEPDAVALPQSAKRDGAARVLRAAGYDFVTFPPVKGKGPEVHAMGGVLGEGDVLGVRIYELGCDLAGAGIRFPLVGIEVGALEVGGPRAQVVHLAYGPYRVVGGRAAAAGVQVSVGVAG